MGCIRSKSPMFFGRCLTPWRLYVCGSGVGSMSQNDGLNVISGMI